MYVPAGKVNDPSSDRRPDFQAGRIDIVYLGSETQSLLFVEFHERAALIARPSPVAAIALNTRALEDEAARGAIEAAEAETGLPADDPVRFGAAKIVDAVLDTVGLEVHSAARRATT